MGPEVFVCLEAGCGKEFANSRLLDRHGIVHSSERPFVCERDDCGKAFKVKHHLSRHMKLHRKAVEEDVESGRSPLPGRTKDKKYPCSQCDKIFKTKFERNVHAATHSSDKPFKCSICSKEFALRNRLKRHEEMHSKTYQCSADGCQFVANLWSQMRKHMAEHHARRCNTCGKEFASSYNLKIHREAVHEKPHNFKCPFEDCDRSYNRHSSLKQHCDAKHSGTLYVCQYPDCEKTFMHSKSLREHQSTHDENKSTASKDSSQPPISKEERPNKSSSVPRPKTNSNLMAVTLSGFDANQEELDRIKQLEQMDDDSPELKLRS